MTAKSRQSPRVDQKPNNYLSRGSVGTVLGVTLLLTAGNVYRAINSFERQQLIPTTSEFFASQKYQPLLIGNGESFAQLNLEELDSVAKSLNYSGSSVKELANMLSQNAATEAEKARIIYAWITQHITYDVVAFENAIQNNSYPDVNSAKVLRDRTTICSGYSNLYQALAEAMGLESAIVVGYAKGATPPDDPRFTEINHAWNSVRIDGAWYLLDATFGAGSIQEGKFTSEYNPYYFATVPQQFLNNHYPQDSGWQLLVETYSRISFDNLPRIATRFHDLGFEIVTHNTHKIVADNQLKIELTAPQNVVAIAELKQGDRDLASSTVLVNRQNENIVVNVAPPQSGTYDLTIYAKPEDQAGGYYEVIEYQIEAQNSTAGLPKIYGNFYEHRASLIEPLSADLTPNWSTHFNLIVPEALDVQVVNSETQQWTSLEGYGSYFAGNVDIQQGKTAVVAKFSGDDRYWQLVEYRSE
ncbi:MAG: transglutaminase domain-containing protein [Cyanobacteria bacterium J06600_6]